MKRELRLGSIAKCDKAFNAVRSNAVRFLLMGLMMMMSGILWGQITYSTPGTYTWTCPPNVTSVQVEAWGGGGAGGGTGTAGVVKTGGGGGGGAYAKSTGVIVIPGNSYTITVGAGGTGVSAANGNNGGNSSFESVVIAAGGSGGSFTNTATGGNGGAGGTTAASTGATLFRGGTGGNGPGTTAGSGAGGSGGGTAGNGGNATGTTAGTVTGGGAGATSKSSNGVGNIGSEPGGGGSGSYGSSGSTTARAGGAGGAGRLILTYTGYCTPSSSSTYHITNVSTNSATTNFTNTSANGNGYSNFYDTKQVIATQGSNFTVSYSGGSGSGPSFGWAIWVDWDKNNVFDTSERVHVTASQTNSGTSGNINIPALQATGDYVMRILADYNLSNPSNPCSFSNATNGGEAEDYKLTVTSSGYTVTFDSNGGAGTMANQTASSPTNLTVNTFTRTGYTFSGWNTAANGSGTAYANGASFPFSANATLYAQWTPTYTLTYNGNGNTGGTVPTDGSSPYTAASTVTVLGNSGSLVRTNYTFAGWNTAAAGNGTDRTAASTFSMPAANTILYAKWTGNVSYNANGGTGTVTDATNYLPGQAVTTASASGFTRAGHAFLNWNTATDGSGATYTASQVAAFNFAGNITLYAIWNPIGSHTVIFEANGGTGTMANQTESTATALSTNAFTRTSYNFNGWNTAADGSGTSYTDGQTYSFASNMTLYAQWALAPALSASPTSLSFGSQCISGTYGPNSFTLSGVALTGANVTVASLSGFSFSTTSGGTYTSSLSLAQSGGTYSQEIFVRFSPVLAQSYNGNIAIGGGGASTINVAVSGSGTFTAPTVTSAVATSVTAQAATLNGNVTVTGCPSIIEKGFVYSLTATDATPTVGEGGVTKTIVAGTATGSYTLALTSLPASTGYSFNSYVYNGTTYYYGSVRQFTTADALGLSGTLAHGTICPTVAATPQTYTITNNSNATVTGISVGSDNTEFAVSGLSATSIAAGGTATYNVTFTPATAGGKSATITVTSSAATVTNTVTGTGTTIVNQSSTTLAATAITNSGATLQAGAPTFGVCPATTAKGFVISQTSVNNDPLIAGTGVTNESVALGTAVAYNKPVSGLTPGVNYTYKSYVYNGTTYVYGSTQNFTVQLPANHLTFVGVPASGTISTNLASFTVEARRPDNSVDTFYTGTITIAKASGSGALSGTLSTAAVAGIATFSTAQFNAADTYTISASSGSLTGTTSGNIVITPVPSIIYQHNFGTSAITGHPYSVSPTATPTPGILNSHLSSSSWTNSGSTSWNSFSGSSGQALALSPFSSSNVWTLTFDVANGYKVDISSFSFWRQSSATTNNWSMTINGIAVGSGTIPSTGSTGTLNVSNAVTNLTGTVTVALTYGGALSGSMRIDDFTLNGFVALACTPPTDPVATISGTTTACTSTVLTYAGADAANAYWQSSPTGTSTAEPVSSTTKTVSASGTHYIRIYSGSCWSLGNASATVTINTAPATAGTPSPANSATGVCYSGSSPVTSVAWAAVSGATSYDVYFGAGSMPGSVTANVTSASYTTGTLSASTTYHWKVVAKNACGDTAGVVANWSFTTASGFCYCTPTGSLDCATYSDYISNVTINTLNHTSTCGAGGYTIVTPTGTQTTTLTQGSAYTFSITGGPGTGAHGAGVYFDWNHDGDFIDPSEFVLISSNVTANATATVTVTVPAGAALGNTRMRVRYAYQQTPDFSNSCTIAGTEGETEDYTISVIAACTPAANPVGSIAGTTPACTSTVLTYVAADAANAYWQSTATGISLTEPVSSTTKTVTTSGTHYVRIHNGSCWSTNSISYAVVINPATIITVQPSSTYAVVGNTATFNVTATGQSLSYQWQEKIGAGSWTNVGINSSSFTTPSTTLPMDGRLYQVIVSGTCGNITSGSALLTVGTVSLCNPIWEENFDFGCANNTNFPAIASNWPRYSGSANDFKYNATGLSYAGYISSGIGGAGEFLLGAGDDVRREFSPTSLSSGPVYASFLINFGSGTTSTNEYFMSLVDAAGSLQGRVYVSKSGSQYRLGVSKQSFSVPNNQTGLLNFGTTYLVVIKYNMRNESGNTDTFQLWALSGGIPVDEAAAGASVNATTSGTDAGNLKYLALRQTGSYEGLVDGIRVGTSWADVVCGGTPVSKTYTWTGGAGSTLWTAANNWSPAGVPGTIDNVIINSAPTSLLNITDCRQVKDFTINGTGNFNMSSTGTLTITGNITYGGTATATLDCDSYVYITSPSSQTIPPLNYGNLDAMGGDRIFPNGGTIGICSGFNVNPTLHTYTVTGSTVNYFSPDTGWGMFPFTYHNLTFSGTGSFSMGGGWSSYSGTKVINVLGNFTQTNGTINFTTNGYDFSNSATINILGNMAITGGTFNMKQGTDSSVATINLQGNLVAGNPGILTATGTATATDFNFTGTANQLVSGTGTINLYRSTINKPSGYVVLQRSLEIKRVLTMTSGNIATNVNTLTLGESTSNVGTLSYTSGFVIGKMTRWFATGATAGNSGFFPLGTSANQSRFATINYANVTTSGRLTAEVINTDMGSIGTITIPAAGSCSAFDPKTGSSFYWKLTPAAIVGTTYTANFTEETATATPLCNLALLNRTSTAWASTGTHSAATGTPTRYTVSRSGLTGYGDFGVGKKGLCATTKIWAAGVWTGGDGFAPTLTDAIVFAGNYDTETSPALPNIASCECTINPGATVTITSGKTLSIEYGLSISDNVTPTDPTDDGKLIILDGGSLIQIADVDNATANNNTGKMNMQRITKPVYRYDFTYWSSPLHANSDPNDDAIANSREFTLKSLSPMTLFDKYFKWNHAAATPGWQAIPAGAESMIPGRGYIVRAPQNYGSDAAVPASYQPYTANFIGTPNNGTVRHNVSGPDKWNLLGNPYPSALSADAFFDANVGAGPGSTNSLEGTLYFWTHNTKITLTGTPHIYAYNAGDYAAYNGTGSTNTKESENDPTPGDPDDNKPTGYIAAGQSFFVKGTANGQAVFTNTMRVSGNNNQFFRPSTTEPLNNWEVSGKHRIWLNMKGQTKGFNQLLVGYVENATNEWDIRFDGESFSGNQVTFYSLLADKNLTIQGRALPFNNQDQVPLGYKSTLNGMLTISIDQYDGLFENQGIYLEDKLLNIVHDLKTADYNFTSSIGTFNERFVLRYLPSVELGNPDLGGIANGLILYQQEGSIMLKSQLEDIDQVIVYDLLGRIVFDQKRIGKREYSIQSVVMDEQPLIVKVVLANGQVVNKKIVY